MFVDIKIDDEGHSSDKRIENVSTALSQNGKKANVTFDYAKDKEYLYCFIYDITDEEFNNGISLEMLMASNRNADIIDRRTPHDHVIELSRNGRRCLLFAARYDNKTKTYYLVNQKSSNVTEQLKVLPTIRCSIRYEGIKTGFLKLTSSKMQKAIIYIGGDAPIPGTYMIYRCKGGGRDQIKFGIDIPAFWNKELEIIIKKEEKIEISSSGDNSYLLQI